MSLWRRQWYPTKEHAYQIFKDVAPPHFAVLILTILVLITPVARAIGQGSFLVIAYLLLFFYPYGRIGEHAEKVVIHLSMCALGQGISFLTVCGTVWIDGSNRDNVYSTSGSKALGACVLILLCFTGGICQSLYPRIKPAIRILLFSSTWTICTGATIIDSTIFTRQFYPAALSAGVSLLSILLIFPRTAQDDFAILLIKSFSIKRSLLHQSVFDFFQDDPDLLGSRKPSQKLIELRKEALDMTTELTVKFESARLELNYERLAITEAKPLLSTIKRTKGWITCGMGLGTREASDIKVEMVEGSDSSSPDVESAARSKNKIELDTLKGCIDRLLQTLTSSISIVEASIELTMRGGSPIRYKNDERWNILYQVETQDETKKPSLTLLRQRHKLQGAIDEFKGDLAAVLKRLAATTASTVKEKDKEDSTTSTTSQNTSRMFHSDTYDVAFLMISLVEIAKDVGGALVTCQTMIAVWHSHQRKRLWFPSVSASHWMRGKLSFDSESHAIFDHDLLEADRRDMVIANEAILMENEKSEQKRSPRFDFSQLTHQVKVVRWRIRLSNALIRLKRSIHVRYGLKLAGGVALLSLPSWLSGARSWFENERGVWLIVTYIWVLETSTGATILVSFYRAIGTIAGAVWAIITWYICNQGNRYGIVVFVVLAQIPASYFIIYSKRAQSMGVVFGLTQSVILFVPLVAGSDGGESASVVHLGLVRGYQILLGIGAGFLVNIFIWPLHARVFLVQTLSHITRQCGTMYLSLAKQMLSHDIIVGPETISRFEKLEEHIQLELVASREYLDIMHVEISLVPKPTHTISLIIKMLQRIADLLILLRKCREVALRIIRKEACFNVLNLRKELVSSILLSFWIIGQSLITKERLPQFLPSCRGALEELTEAMKEQIDHNHLQVQLGREKLGSETPVDWNQGAWISSPSPARNSISSPSPRRHNNRSTHTPPATRRPKIIDYSYFFVFAEHTLLSEIIFEVEKLLFLTKLLVGESSFIDSEYLPNDFEGEAHQNDRFDPRTLDADDLNAFHHSMSEHGIDGRRLASQLESHLRAAKGEK